MVGNFTSFFFCFGFYVIEKVIGKILCGGEDLGDVIDFHFFSYFLVQRG